MQAKEGIDEYLDNTLVNKLIESPVPKPCLESPCILGIDEAGRGPVLGPMVYAIAYYPQEKEDVLKTLKFADSKELTEANREKLFEALQTRERGYSDIGYIIKVISPNMISNSMQRRKKYNLNLLSHDTAIELIKTVKSKGVKIAHVYVDTVGPPLKYKEKLEKFFPGTHFTVTEKADSKYPIVSAASVCAKVPRDRIVSNWKYIEDEDLNLSTFELGSGYPADPNTKKYLERVVDPVFGYPILTRFSWSTITKLLEKHGCECDFNEPSDDEEDQKGKGQQRTFMQNFFVKKKPTPSSIRGSKVQSNKETTTRTNADTYFDERSLKRVTSWR